MTKANANAKAAESEKLIATNPNGRANYFISETFEAGIALVGTEVKSIRNQSPNIRDAYVEISTQGKGLEAWLVNTHIGPYSHGNIWNHEPMRRRKLLLHRKEIERLYGAFQREGSTLVPLRMYFKNGRVKIEIGLGKGKKKHDKRQDIKKRTAEREMQVARKQKNR